MVADILRGAVRTDHERALLTRAGEGDREALSALLVPHQALLFRVCVSQLLSLPEAEDAVQETFVKAIRALTSGQFARRSSLKTYLIRIAVNVCQDARKSRRESVSLSDVTLLTAGADNKAVENAAIREALSSLAPRQRAVFLLRDIEEWSRIEVAEALGVTARRVDYELSLAHKALEVWREKWTKSE
jgi:RNA polymerase sigma-70 factor, ECF subfamily